MIVVIFFFKQKTAYEMRISDWSSDVCSSDLGASRHSHRRARAARAARCGPVLSPPGGLKHRLDAGEFLARIAVERGGDFGLLDPAPIAEGDGHDVAAGEQRVEPGTPGLARAAAAILQHPLAAAPPVGVISEKQ